MDELIKNTWNEWKAAKSAAQSFCHETARYDMAEKLGACSMFTGNEDLQELVKLMFTPRGVEFMTKYHFPNIETFRKFKPLHPERYGVYIDCGEISLSEAKKVFLVGNTVARLKYWDIASNRLYLMCGAVAHIDAGGYSVVRVEKDDISKVEYMEKDHASVLL